MEGTNYYTPGGMNNGRRKDNRYQQQQQYSYGRPNVSQEHQMVQASRLPNNNNNNNNDNIYNHPSRTQKMTPGNQYPPSLQNQKSSQMKSSQNQQFPPSSSNKPYNKEFHPPSHRNN